VLTVFLIYWSYFWQTKLQRQQNFKTFSLITQKYLKSKYFFITFIGYFVSLAVLILDNGKNEG